MTTEVLSSSGNYLEKTLRELPNLSNRLFGLKRTLNSVMLYKGQTEADLLALEWTIAVLSLFQNNDLSALNPEAQT